jgi:isopentenyl diphosphate isomerase/L-lactate dehydrogenase-like FMN-dependent dehydrogenase
MRRQLQVCMFACGAGNLEQLRNTPLVRTESETGQRLTTGKEVNDGT